MGTGRSGLAFRAGEPSRHGAQLGLGRTRSGGACFHEGQPPAEPHGPSFGRHPTASRHIEGRSYYDGEVAESKTLKESLRALKRRISAALYTASRQEGHASGGPGRKRGNGSVACAAGSHPVVPGSSSWRHMREP